MENKLRSLHKETGICIGWKWISAAIHTQVNKQQSFGFFFFFCRSKMTSFFFYHTKRYWAVLRMVVTYTSGTILRYQIDGDRDTKDLWLPEWKTKIGGETRRLDGFFTFSGFFCLVFFFFSFGLGFLLLKKKNIWPLSFFFLKINDRKVQK